MAYLVRHFQEAGLKGLGKDGDWYQDFAYGPKNQIKARNVLAAFPGKGTLANEAVIVSAHHDHLGVNPELVKAGKDGIYNGADDNASGCAGLLLIAKALGEDKRLPSSYRTVIFASFDAEEHGLVGSRHYVREPLWPLNKTTADVNFDMIGRLRQGKVMAADSETSAFVADRVKALAAQCGLGVETRLNGSGRADNQSFLEQAIPTVHFNTGLHADYHQVTDEVSKIDSEGGARISWLAYRLLREVMDNPERLRFRRPPPDFDINGLIRLVMRLGIVPELNTQSGRYPLIRAVLPNTLASKQGIRANDEITSINGQKFASLFDAAILLGKLRLDRDIKFTVARMGKTVEVTIPAAALKNFAGPTARPLDNDQYEVEFRFKPAMKVDSAALAGTFNNWDGKTLVMEGPDPDGFYKLKRTLTRGTYEYKFVVDGNQWVADPRNLRTAGTVGNSVLILGRD